MLKTERDMFKTEREDLLTENDRLERVLMNVTQMFSDLVTRLLVIASLMISEMISVENPADLLTRGVTVISLKSKDLWWSGPPWMYSSQSYQPQ
ncbi:hypothetical protein NPIL_273181 [Nephila pilipes]|uniref:Uncharacterized protein n=1 Tax=Nephila pilipes TaxID=299642 RepID=A0A8X6PU65_NEPPI|nr:hypothetical protein NPIL_273181 [Nephila pilipes]